MKKTTEEKRLLTKLASGLLDGMVGDERVYRGYKNVYCGKHTRTIFSASQRITR